MWTQNYFYMAGESRLNAGWPLHGRMLVTAGIRTRFIHTYNTGVFSNKNERKPKRSKARRT